MIYIPNSPYKRGIFKVAPIKFSIDDESLSIDTVTDDMLLEPLQDIIDICGTNPQTISFNKNTLSSEEGVGRDASLNMHKDILGRVRDFTVTFPPLTQERYDGLDAMFMSKTELINIDEEEETPSESEELENIEYIIWYLIEIMTPEGNTIREVCYVGDSSFTGSSTTYVTRNVPILDENDNITGYESRVMPICKDLKINLIGKTQIARR